MKIDKITLTNFRQYFNENSIDLNTNSDRNIILIGGKNGYGKTNFLLSLVWCLYGEDIGKIDENFKREIQKEGNYSKFLKGSLNWDAAKNGNTCFSVSIEISDIELPEIFEIKSSGLYKCKIARQFDVTEIDDSFEITIEGISKSLFSTNEDKINFINDYLIPIEAAKFVFFDAEKIASWAELSTKEEGSVLNDALGKILGLDTYESLIADLNIYTDLQRKESATNQVRQQITSTENGIKINIEKIEDLENDVIKRENQITELKLRISEYEVFLVKHSNKSYNARSLEELYRQKDDLKRKEKELEGKFNELSEVLPFAISAGKMEEIAEHLTKQESESITKEKRRELIEKNNELIEKLFNTPPFPGDGDISFSRKVFYAEKARKIIEEVFGKIDESNELEFEHDLNKSEKDLVYDTFNHLRKQSKDIFEQTIENFNRVKNDITENDRIVKKIESDLEDEEVIEYTNKKNDAERKIEKLSEEKGGLITQKQLLTKTNESLSQKLQIDLKRISVSEQKKRKLDKANQYIKSLLEFVESQKREKCVILETIIFDEMKKLMHKLNDNDGQNNFIGAVKVEILPDNDGLKILLYDNDGNIRQKETLSQGEKQIYISSLIKAILSLAIQEFPIFIDTPLGRLDDEHIKHILLYYYPDLASQVILMATNNEIPPSRLKLVKENVAKTYLLENNNNQTKFKQGYFQSYEN
ncbi:MAG: DNA sulfur modification protein DndD [Ignavibacteriaceae bacterium]|nr:DNA sulfur modification protein DndD [Ignavibacteriaceae bacterium]